ncbi:MAG: phosphoadenylyl-sulfate reductase [Mariprofundaceae bacterium]|nr:phosphoadenylyl-sulfate reductase [Mariprofundaceae bacterium]
MSIDSLVASTVALLQQARDRHGDLLVYPCALGSEGMVQIDLICRMVPGIRIVTLDTGRLPQATYDLMQKIREKYGINLDVRFPDAQAVQEMVNTHGVNLFYDSVENRELCCSVRKIEPLRRALAGMEAWITGRRRDQSENRSATRAVENDPVFGLKKYNPMLDWAEEDIWVYIRQHDVPYNRLHDEHYVSIGCECCTRSVTVGEDPRAGRWWWENEDTLSECGLHVSSLSAHEGESGEGI